MAGTLSILLVDDDENDAILFRMAAKSISRELKICWANGGSQAIDLLEGKEQKQLPDLLILDLKMPVMNGFEFLTWLRRQPRLGSIPVIILSASEFSQDVEQAYGLGAQSFLHKPCDFEALTKSLEVLLAFWGNCKLPTPSPDSSIPSVQIVHQIAS